MILWENTYSLQVVEVFLCAHGKSIPTESSFIDALSAVTLAK